jgi:hypothetical protein
MTPQSESLHQDALTDDDIARAMQLFGGSFITLLGKAWQFGDTDNRRRIQAAFPEAWAQYRELALMKRRRDALADGGVA